MKKLLHNFLILSILLGLSSNAKAIDGIRIYGNFPNAGGKTIHVFKYNDLITKKLTEISQATINSKGNFDLNLKLSNLEYIFLQIDFFRVQFYVMPKTEYKLTFDTIDVNNPMYFPSTVVGFLSPNFELNANNNSDINAELEKVNTIYSDFVDQNYLALRTGNNLDSISTSFAKKLDSLSAISINKATIEDIAFKKNSLLQMAHKLSREEIINSHFKAKSIQYSNKIYMDYFNNFWSGTFTKTSKFYKPSDIDSAIVMQKSLPTLNAMLKKDPSLSDSILRELVILSSIAESYYNKRFNTQAFENILLQISLKTKKAEHKIIADNLLKRFNSLKNGEQAPDFQLTDLQQNNLQLKTFEGKYIYFYFFTTQNSESLAEMEVIRQKLYDEFEDVIEFVCVSIDQNVNKLNRYNSKEKYKFRICHFNQNFELLEAYKVQIIPSSILINKKGKIESLNPPLPSQDFSSYFLKLLNDKKGNLR